MSTSARNANFRAHQAVALIIGAVLAWLGCAVASFRIVSRALREWGAKRNAVTLARRPGLANDLGGSA